MSQFYVGVLIAKLPVSLGPTAPTGIIFLAVNRSDIILSRTNKMEILDILAVAACVVYCCSYSL